MLAVAAAVVSLSAGQAHSAALKLKPCTLQGVQARCGTFVVPENRTKPHGRTISLRVVVLPAWMKPVEKDAVTYLAGGPGGAATEEAAGLSNVFVGLNAHHDVLLVDQRGTGKSNPFSCPTPTTPLTSKAVLRTYTRACLKAFGGDASQYGTRAAMDDLDAVRAALGYEQLDVVGGSYGATAAQVYLKLHPSSVRTVTLEGATAIDVPIFGRWAVNAQRALDQLARRCAAQPACRIAYPNWESQFRRLVKAWDANPATIRKGRTMSGVELASIVHAMLVDGSKAVSIPLVVSRAAAHDYTPLLQAGNGDMNTSLQIMYWSIWCSEPWAGLESRGPWGTAFDSYASAFIAGLRQGCTFMPKRPEPRALWTFPSSQHVPVLAIEGGADPQDPVANLPDLRRNFADSRAVIVPRAGHQFGIGGCIGKITETFVERATTRGLDTSCVRGLPVPQLTLPG